MINMEKFSFAADSIDQDRIPQFLLSDGNKMPCIGYKVEINIAGAGAGKTTKMSDKSNRNFTRQF